MTAMKVTVPDTVALATLLQQIVMGLADRLRDDHRYEWTGRTRAACSLLARTTSTP